MCNILNILFLQDVQLSAHFKKWHKLAVGLWNYNSDKRCPYSENNAYIYRDICDKFQFIDTQNY
jgi:hypothetical protein